MANPFDFPSIQDGLSVFDGVVFHHPLADSDLQNSSSKLVALRNKDMSG